MKKRRKSTHKRSERAEKLQQCHKANVRGDREEKFSRLIHKLLSCRIVWTRFHRTIVSSKEWNFMLLVYRAKSEVRIRQSGNIFVMLNLTRECWTRISNIRKEKEKKERAIKKCRNKYEWKESISNISWRILCELRKPDRRRAAEIIKKVVKLQSDTLNVFYHFHVKPSRIAFKSGKKCSSVLSTLDCGDVHEKFHRMEREKGEFNDLIRW